MKFKIALLLLFTPGVIFAQPLKHEKSRRNIPAGAIVGGGSSASGAVLTSSGSVVIQSTVSTAGQAVLKVLDNAGVHRFSVQQDGSVVIGTAAAIGGAITTSSGSLVVQSTSATGGHFVIQARNNAGTNIWRVDQNGNRTYPAGSTTTASGNFYLSTAATSGSPAIYVSTGHSISSLGQYGTSSDHNATEVLASGGGGRAMYFGGELYDRGSMHDATNSSDTVTVPAQGAGLYYISCGLAFAANATGGRYLTITINGTAKIRAIQAANAAGDVTIVNVTDVRQLTDADVVKCVAFQDSGGNLNVGNGVDYSWFTVQKVW